MTRIVDEHFTIHYTNPANDRQTLCGATAGGKMDDLFGGGRFIGWPTTHQRVTCPNCAKVVCAIRNEPYNTLEAEIAEATLEAGMYAAVQPDGPVPEEDAP